MAAVDDVATMITTLKVLQDMVTDLATVDPRGRRATYTGETIYEGNTTVPQGKGVITVVEEGPNKGNTYAGQFKAGKMHGVGTWDSGASGSKYAGNWKAGSFHGEGVFTWDDGTQYKGSFFDDQFHGRGAKTAPGGAVLEAGLWWQDEFFSDMATVSHVEGLATVDPRGRAVAYTGDTVEGLMDGNGSFVVTEAGPNNGNTFRGQFHGGKMHGTGTWTSKESGSSYSGDWVNGGFHGQGTFVWADGTQYVGEFMDDKFHGRGTKTLANGTVEYAGLWWCDEPVEEQGDSE